ncbi:hypothetical protein [Marivirga sp.]|uniref:hypothetical protein n=1 Tax=Marivirga sp. TaxID=2018662 RepID=UPI002D7F9D23|nr:hypothetical protein [Marivirga sp.]HET8859261.1 hypothetical protein [Marivirga sp.]
MSETNYFRLIEAYFEGSISPAEKVLLDAKINSDPLVKAEFNLQQNIINGISNSRKLALKSRLASIELPTTTGILSGSSVKWLAGTVAGVTLFGTILYWSLISLDNNIKPIDLKMDQKIVFRNETTVGFPILMEKKNKELKDNILSNSQDKSDKEGEKIAVESSEKVITAKVQPQSLMSFEDDIIFTDQRDDDELKSIDSRDIAHNRADKTEIEFLDPINNSENFNYRYFNSKLYLYGDFKEMPYQIIELNDKGKKQLFLSHNKEIYIIHDNTTEITELRKIQDDMLKMEIQLIVEE